jgi:hypothetical protein
MTDQDVVCTGPYVVGVATKRHARLVLRPEHHEWDLVEQHPQLLDAVLLPESYVAPYPSGHLLEGHDPRKLLDTARDAGCDLWRDPETAGLCSRTILRLPATKRLHETPLAREFQMPLDLSLLADPEARRHALELVLATQDGSEMLAGPYFDFDRRDSPAHRLNLQMARETTLAAEDQVPGAFLQLTHHGLLRGLLTEVAADYQMVGVRRVVIRVRGLKSEQADAQELTAYLDAVDAFTSRGIEAVADCAGKLGPVLVAAGAEGFSTGTRFFKCVPAALLSASIGGGGPSIAAQPAGTWSEVAREPEQSAHDTRVANLLTLREHTDLAVSDPDELIASLRADGGAQPAIWANVLAQRRRRAA